MSKKHGFIGALLATLLFIGSIVWLYFSSGNDEVGPLTVFFLLLLAVPACVLAVFIGCLAGLGLAALVHRRQRVSPKIYVIVALVLIIIFAKIYTNHQNYLNETGVLVPRSGDLFQRVVGIPMPTGTFIKKASSTDFPDNPTDWLSLTVPKEELTKILAAGHFHPNYGLVGVGGFYPTRKEIAKRHNCILDLGNNHPPPWWTPAYKPNCYVVFEEDERTEDKDDLIFHYLVVPPSGNTVYAARITPG